jgi:hypothetical protein
VEAIARGTAGERMEACGTALARQSLAQKIHLLGALGSRGENLPYCFGQPDDDSVPGAFEGSFAGIRAARPPTRRACTALRSTTSGCSAAVAMSSPASKTRSWWATPYARSNRCGLGPLANAA